MKKGKLLQIPLDEIDFGKRYREINLDSKPQQESIAKLAYDIKKVGGLIHPVTVADKTAMDSREELESVETDAEKRYLLLAGGRRTTAYITHKIEETIPAYVHPQVLQADEIREIELMENVQREDLTWQERSQLVAEYHRLQEKLKGKKHTSSEGGHGLKDTGEDLGVSKGTVKNELDLAEALKIIPELKNIKNKTDALKTIRELKKTDKAQTSAKRMKRELKDDGADAVKKRLMNSFVVGDFFEEAEKLKPHSFDIVEIDPPYGIDLGNVKKKAKHKTLNYNEVPADEYEQFLIRTLAHAKKLIKPNGWLIFWYAIDPWHASVAKAIQKAGFKMSELPCIWVKNGGQTNRPHQYFGSCYEPFFYARPSNNSKLNKGGVSNYLIHPKVPPNDKIHPTQRPIGLMEELLVRFKVTGRVLVPFAGSGVTLRAAYNLGMEAVGFDLSQDAKNKHDVVVGEHDFNEHDKFQI